MLKAEWITCKFGFAAEIAASQIYDYKKGSSCISWKIAFTKHGIFIKKVTVGDEGFDSSFLNKKYYYQIQYFDLHREKTSSLKAAYISVEFDKKHFQERQWLTINDSAGFLVVFEQSTKKGIVTRLTISNVMNSPSYKAELDTSRYIYRPKFN